MLSMGRVEERHVTLFDSEAGGGEKARNIAVSLILSEKNGLSSGAPSCSQNKVAYIPFQFETGWAASFTKG